MSDPWEMYDYEVDMFRRTLDLCALRADHQHPTSNALAESMLLHLRILADILLSRSANKDDIRLNALLPDFKSARIKELKTAYGNLKKASSPCWTLNNILAHATSWRSDQYDYAPMLNTLLPTISALVEEINAEKDKMVA